MKKNLRNRLVIACLSLACAITSESFCATESTVEPVKTSSGVAQDQRLAGAWETAAPEAYDVDTNALTRSLQRLPEICPELHSLLMVRHGRLITERYFGGTATNDAWNIKSASKSVLSALTGIALERGFIRSLDQPVLDFFPEYLDQVADSRKKQITIRHLLTMTAGLEWEENGPIEHRWLSSRDWIGFTLKSKLVATPGSKWNYSTALTHLLSATLTKASGTNTLDLAQRCLFGPIGSKVDRWDKDPQGYYCGGWEVYLTPRDMAKFGCLYLNGGKWDGKQIVPATWVQASTQQTNSAHYGFLWWLDTFEGLPMYFAQGLGGQHIVIVPDLDAVVVTTSFLPTHISALSFIKLFVLPCLKRPQEDSVSLPQAQEIVERYYTVIGGREKLAKLKSLRIAGTLAVPATSECMSFEILKGGSNKIYSTSKGPFKRVGSNGHLFWTQTGGYRILTEKEARSWREEANTWTDLRGPLKEMRTLALTSFAGRSCHQIQSTGPSGEYYADFFDIETGLLTGSIRSEEVRPYGLVPVTRLFDNYRKFGEFQVPTKIICHIQGPEVVYTRTTVEYDKVDSRVFGLPIPIEDILKGKRVK